MIYFITGGAGFIGSTLSNRLAREGHVVRVLDDCSAGEPARLLPEVQPEMLAVQAPEHSALQGRQLWVSHGTHDAIVPTVHAQSIRRQLEHTPIRTTFREFAVGHELRVGEVAATVSWVEELATRQPSF